MKVTEQVAAFAEPVVREHGCSLWDVEYVREGSEYFLRLYIDKDGGVLDSDDRQALAQRDIPLSDATFDALDNELQNIYACLAQPTEHLHISWPVTDVTGAELRPSFVVERVARLFPRTKIRREDGAYRLTLPAAALCAAGDDPQLWQYFVQSPRYAAANSYSVRALSRAVGRSFRPVASASSGRRTFSRMRLISCKRAARSSVMSRP